MVLGKHEIEAALHAEKQEINAGRLKEDSPLDVSEEFRLLCEACRRGDLKTCQEKIQEGVRINARDKYDYTPLNLASLCGHYEVVRLLLESGALCERDTFEGERCLYNALNDRIRNLLLLYDYSKSRDPLQPLSGHVTGLINREVPLTSDITIKTDRGSLELHKFILSARSPFFAKRLAVAPQTTSWKVSPNIPSRSLEIAITALYLGEASYDFSSSDQDQAILRGIEKLSNQLEVKHVYDSVLEMDRRLARQRYSEEVQRGRDQLEAWFMRYVLGNCIQVEASKVESVRWDRENSMFADVLLCAEEPDEESEEGIEFDEPGKYDEEGTVLRDSSATTLLTAARIPVGSFKGQSAASKSPSRSRGEQRRGKKKSATLFPVHRAMLIRCEYFLVMFSSAFREAQPSEHLPIVHFDYSPAVLRVILSYLYTESTDFGLDVAIDVLFAADQLLIDKLKSKAAVVISTLGNGNASVVEADNSRGATWGAEDIDIYDVIRAGWDTRMQRLEEFGARYIAYRLEKYVEEREFKTLIKESAARIKARQETDTIELIDDIRHFLDERFRLRFEDVYMDEMIDNHRHGVNQQQQQQQQQQQSNQTSSAALAALNGVGASGNGVSVSVEGQEEKENGVEEEKEEPDEFDQDAIQYKILLEKIDSLLEELDLDA